MGGVAIILNIIFPALTPVMWAYIMAFITAFLLFRAAYRHIESASLLFIGFFTTFTFVSLYFLNYTPYALQITDIISGLTLSLPKESVAYAIAAFGITGVGGDEIIYYTYWCIEKGYAKNTGPNDGSEEWVARAKGWIRIMKIDAILSMVLYTVVTIAFYLLGAAVLHEKGTIPQGFEMIHTLSEMYTSSLGPKARMIFLIGAFVVLFSTLFTALAAWVRLYADMFGSFGWINYNNLIERKKTISWLAWVFPILWASMFSFIQLPVLMVLSGGIAGSIVLLLVVRLAINFRYRRQLPEFKPSILYDVALWCSVIGICWISIYGLYQLISS